MIVREKYLQRLRDFIDKPFIKVITGIRRSGKSTLLLLLKDELITRRIREANIIHINLESFDYSEIITGNDLYALVKSKIINQGRYYILLDEIQEVAAWEKAVDAMVVDLNIDLYLTGSNSKLLSSELATHLAGRYIDIHIQTLTFSEYLQFREPPGKASGNNYYQAFSAFLRFGGFPVIHTSEYTIEAAYKIVFDIYSSAILRDIVQRYNIRDIELLERVVKFIFENVGSRFSAKNIADYFKSQQRKIDLNTVYNYLEALESAFIIYRVHRYDLKGKEILKTLEKFYLGDHSLLYAVMGYKDRLISGVLENIVMLELKHRGYKVFTGKSEEREVDFIAEQKEKRVYVQVAYHLSEPSTISREFSPLLQVKDHYPKYVVTMDETWSDNIQGVRHFHIADFLMLNEY